MKLISQNAGIQSEDFEIFKQFDDSISLNLVLAICETTNRDPAEILESFGEYFVKKVYESEYRNLLTTFSSCPTNLIKSLNNLHDRLEMSFTELNPPSFDVVSEEEKSLTVNYYSDRDMPLEYFVKGLFQGIFQHFGENCEVIIQEEILGDAKATIKILHD